MDEDFVVKIGLHHACLLNKLFQLLACSVVLLWLRVDHVDKRAAVRNVSLRVVLQLVIAWEVKYVEADVVVGLHFFLVDLRRCLQEEALMRR